MINKPLAVVLTDTHLKRDNLDLVYNIFVQAYDLANLLGVDYVIHGGDFFTNRIGQNLMTLITMKKILGIFEGTGITLVGIPGNHDKTDLDSEDSYLDVFDNTVNFQLVRNFRCIKMGDISVGFLPYFSNSYKARLKELETLREKVPYEKSILITHVAFNGVRNNDGSVVEDAISPKDVKSWDKVLVGHYHDGSEIGKNIFYIGSAYQGNYGENIEDKGFTILMENGDIDFEPTNFPKYIKIKLDVNDDVDNEIEMYGGKEDNVRFIFSGDKSEIHKVDQAKLSSLGIDCKFELNDINEEILKIESGDLKELDQKAIIKYFAEYCKIQGIDSISRKRGLKILKQNVD